MQTDSELDKAALRRSLLQHRQSMSRQDWQQKSHQICTHLQASSLLAEAKTVLAYFSFRQEPDLSALFTLPHQWGFPRCVGKALFWHLWFPNHPLLLQIGKYGILEPHPDAPELGLADVDLILVPAIACDRRGYRLGYGGGFYDRLLSSSDWAAKPTIGIVFEFAHLPQLPIDPWDLPLKAVCTEAGLFEVDTSM
jgi:5-formyltetrahydrofolate cyclo-ligase